MKFTMKKLAIAVAVVAASSQALALTPQQITDCRIDSASRSGANTCPSTENLVTTDISGASATTQVMQDLAVQKCKAGTIAHYKDTLDPAKPGKRFNTYACQLDGTKLDGVAVDLADGTPILIANQSPGSFEGVGPVARRTSVEFMNVEGTLCTLAAAGAVDIYNCPMSTTSTHRVKRWFCDGGVDDANLSSTYSALGSRCSVPTAGVSDEEPAMFAFAANSPSPVGADEIAVLDSDTFFAQPFGVVISTTFADALRAQGDESAADAAGFTYPVLSKAYIRSTFALGSGVTAADAAPSLLGDQAALAVCRRKLGSGTHVAQNLFFMGKPCHSAEGLEGAVDFDNGDVDIFASGAANNAASDAIYFEQHVTVEGQGSSDLEDCVEAAQDGRLANQLNENEYSPVFAANASLSAIGYQSFGKKKGGPGDGEAGSNRWQYVAINGVAPTVDNIATGRYEHVWEATMQWIKPGEAGAPSADQVSLLDELRRNGGRTDVIADAGAGGKIVGTSGSDVPDGAGGFLARRAQYLHYGNSCNEPTVNTNVF